MDPGGKVCGGSGQKSLSLPDATVRK